VSWPRRTPAAVDHTCPAGLARRLGARGRTTVDKPELVDAVKKANRRETAKARRR
jgi:hypothetical protein